MPRPKLALTEAISVRPIRDAEKPRRAVEAVGVVACSLAHVERPLPSRYRARPWPDRLVALSIVVAIHLAILAVLVATMHDPTRVPQPDRVVSVTLLPLAPDTPAKKKLRGVAAARLSSTPVPAEAPPPISSSLREPNVVAFQPEPALEPPTPLPIPAEGGKIDQPEQSAQSYRRALTARLEAQRSYPRFALLDGYQGVGAILFHIDRDGRLLDATINASTGREALDRAALDLVRRAAPFPAMPADMPDRLEVALPIRFLIVTPGTTVAAR